MVTAAAPPSLCEDDAYRREARRLRARLAHRPAELHASLAKLRRSAVTTTPPPRQPPVGVRRAVPRPSPVAESALMAGRSPDQQRAMREFLNQASRALADRAHAVGCSSPLTYDEQAALLAQAERAGIGRFHANLALAVLWHDLAEPRQLPGEASRHDEVPTPSRRYRQVSWVMTGVLVGLALAGEAIAAVWVSQHFFG